MAEFKDIKLKDGDLDFFNGDFSIGASDQQHVEDIIRAYVGHYKEFPTLGVGIDLYINASGSQLEIQRSIKLQLESDGFKVNNVVVDQEGKILIDAERI
jgi:hypothetical protein